MIAKGSVKSRQGPYFRMKNIYFNIMSDVIKMRNIPTDRNNPVVSGHSLNAEKKR